ncbi:MAG TPA: PQQ-dependent sugar dehydrogenase [Verrucomicrobia bacterium]|nr:PQQ-dependent sugar dehydrogenase [Verrucomicrobiota bacterium]HOP97878.1 PQQ-dependent sugar dehydrogenase [Verrucomicrobiota bacterium]
MKRIIPLRDRLQGGTFGAVPLAGVLGLILLGCCWALPSRADILGLQRVASGLSAPIFVTHAPGDGTRLFIVERGGGIRILNLESGQLEPTPFLSIPNVDTAGEGGLLGLAFHPGYQTNGRFYVNVTLDNGVTPFSTHVREYTVSAANTNIADPASVRTILTFQQPQANHNGGWIGFSPNHPYLYIATGDGGGGDDNDAGHTPGIGNAQDTTNNWLGKILRVDVDGDAFPADTNRNYAIPPSNPFVEDERDDEIFAYGLRNPFRASFDRATGDLWIGDVGQSAREEIDFLPASSSGGENFGWRLREGRIATPSGGVGGLPPPGAVDPVYDYDRDADQFGGTVVTGGYVYRGPDPTLQGKYFFLDSRNSASTADDNYWMFDPADPFGTVVNIDHLLVPDIGTPMFPVSFGEDLEGNLYIAYIASGDVYRIRTSAPPAPLLGIELDANADVVLSWGTNFTGFTLEASTNLAGGLWEAVLQAPDIVGTNHVVTNAVSGSERYYRLRQ